MAINFPTGDYPYANASRNVASRPQAPSAADFASELAREVKLVKGVKEVKEVAKGSPPELDKESLKTVLERTTSLLSAFDRSLRYEMSEEAGILQIQVINSRDGNVVRKIPADEVVKMVTHIKKLLQEVKIEA